MLYCLLFSQNNLFSRPHNNVTSVLAVSGNLIQKLKMAMRLSKDECRDRVKKRTKCNGVGPLFNSEWTTMYASVIRAS